MNYPWHISRSVILACMSALWAAMAQAGHDVELELGGRLKLDLIHNDSPVSGEHLSRADLAFSPRSIPLTSSTRSDSEFTARESRLWALLRLPLLHRQLSAYAEIDFSETEPDNLGRSRLSNIPRLRHAYAIFGPLTIGKTYTTFVNLSAYPEINDGNGPLGTLNIRQDIVRYTHDFEWGHWQFSVEEPQTTLSTPAGSAFNPEDETTPDLVTRLTWEGLDANLSIAAMARNIEADSPGPGNRIDKWGGALSVAGYWRLHDRDNLRMTLSWGNALGRYVSFGAFTDGALAPGREIEFNDLVSGFVAYQHWWGKNLRSNVVIGLAHLDAATGIVPASANETMASSHLNLLWSPMSDVTVGVEWLYGYRRQVDDRSGNMNRFQLTSIYKF